MGAYTAGAIASIAYGLPEPILDGNVARVLSRLFAIDAAPEAASTKAELWSLARALVPADAPSHFNQAMMELGATVCTPRAPQCLVCPVAKSCRARAEGRQEELPRKRVRKEPPTVEAIAIVARNRRRVLLGRRPPRGLWGGLWEPPWVPLEEGTDAEAAAEDVAKRCFDVELTGRTELTTHHARAHTPALSLPRAQRIDPSPRDGRGLALRRAALGGTGGAVVARARGVGDPCAHSSDEVMNTLLSSRTSSRPPEANLTASGVA